MGEEELTGRVSGTFKGRYMNVDNVGWSFR